MNKDRKYFFVPRKGKNYSQGLYGSRTLIVGAYHVCDLECEFSEMCVADSSSMDRKCPVYKGREEYYRLSNSNCIEIDSFISSEEKYPSYSEFTKFILSKKDYVSDEEKEELWEKVAFYNYAQNYRKTYCPFDKLEDRETLDKDFEAFRDVVLELRPEVIYVWHDAIKDVIDRHISEIPGLKYAVETNMQSLTVHCYTILDEGCDYLKSYNDKLSSRKCNEKIKFLRECISLYSNARNFKFGYLEQKSDFLETLGFAVLLDETVERQLYNDLVFAYFDGQSNDINNKKSNDISGKEENGINREKEYSLRDYLDVLYGAGLITDNRHYIFTAPSNVRSAKPASSENKDFAHKYKRSGFLLYMFKTLTRKNICKSIKSECNKDEKYKMTESEFAYGLGYAKTKDEWRNLKKEYTYIVKNVKSYNFEQIFEELKNKTGN